MYKIIVAGAGHGGLSAAIKLAKNGFDVTVIEAKKRDDLGYDWCDVMRKDTFVFADIPCPDDMLRSCYNMSYMNPKKSVKLADTSEPSKIYKYVERKALLKYLVDYAEECGVKFLFETKVNFAICGENCVKGVSVESKGEKKNLFGDVVIDAAGMNSPVRESLPEHFGIENKVSPSAIFTAYRAFYEKLADEFTDPRYCVFFYNGGRCGMDWMITEDDYMDVLIGGFGVSLTEDDIQTSLTELKQMYPYLGDKILRGGSVEQIPVGKALSKMVFSGYAAIGDSAFMTEPLSGSGMDLAIKAGKILAETIIEAQGDYSTEKLWKYQYRYYKKFAEGHLSAYLIKSMIIEFDSDDIDYLFEKKIVTEKELCERTSAKYRAAEIVAKGASIAAKPKILKGLASMGVKLLAIDRMNKMMPEEYSKEGFEKWHREYEKV